MFIIENGKIQGQKSLNIGKIRVINLAFKGDFAFADEDKFKLSIGSVQSENFGFTNNGYIGFSYINLAEIIKKENTDLSVKVTCNGAQILADSITITAYVQGGGSGEEIQGIVYNAFPIQQSTQVKFIPSDISKDATGFSNAFLNFSNLTSIPQLDTSNGTSFFQMFSGCESLTSIPQINTSKGTNFSYMFYGCKKLLSIPQLDVSNGTNFSYMFSYNWKLTTLPPLDVSNGTNFSSMFNNCESLTSIPQINTSKGTNFSYMFSYTYLTSIPQLDVSNGINFNHMFSYNWKLTTLPPLDVSNGISFGSMFYFCESLTDFGGLLNVKKTYSLTNSTKLTHQSLLNVLNGLYDLTGSTSQTLNLGNINLAKLTDEEKAIATNKNWVLA